MNFQDSGADVSKNIYKLCGKPTLSRRKRKAPFQGQEDNPSYELKYEPMKMHGHKKKKNKKSDEEDSMPSLERLIREIKTVRIIMHKTREWVQKHNISRVFVREKCICWYRYRTT